MQKANGYTKQGVRYIANGEGVARKFDHYDQFYNGHDPMLFSLKMNQFVAAFRQENVYHLIDPDVIVSPNNVNDPDICDWEIGDEIPPAVLPPLFVNDNVIPVMFELPIGAGSSTKTSCCYSWLSQNHVMIYENYFPLISVPKLT